MNDLQAKFPGWRIWRSRNERGDPAGWYATRLRKLSGDEMKAGLHATLDADSLDQLADKLRNEEG